MLLRASPALSLFSSLSEAPPPVAFLRHRQPMSGVLRITRTERSSARVVAATGDASNKALTGFLFEPFEEVKHELALVPSSPDKSLARQKYVDECEAAINEQINVEYNVSYVYHAMFSYFDRDNVALRGMAKFFKESSEEEREHAEKLMKYQNKRGGRVKLQSILMPLTEFNHEEKGDALYGDTMKAGEAIEEQSNEVAQKFYDLLKAAQRPLWDGYSTHYKLSVTVKMLSIKTEYSISRYYFNQFVGLLKETNPQNNLVPKDMYKTKKLVSKLGLTYKKIDCCINNCMLFCMDNS